MLLMFEGCVYRVVRLFYHIFLRKEYPSDSIRHNLKGVGERKRGILFRVVIYRRNCKSVGYLSTAREAHGETALGRRHEGFCMFGQPITEHCFAAEAMVLTTPLFVRLQRPLIWALQTRALSQGQAFLPS